MKKKLLAVVLSVVMLVALLVPMLAISADGPAATIYLGTPVILEGRDYDGDEVAEAAKLLGVPVLISNNNDEFYTAIYQVLSENGLKPYFASFGEGDDYYEDLGYDDGDFTKKIGAKWVTLNTTISHNPNDTDKKGFQVVQDSNGGTRGISAESGTLITVYFEMPTTPGTYTFTLVWLSGTNNVPVDYTMAVNPNTATYTVEGNCAHPGEIKDTVNSIPAKCGVGGTDIFICTECGEELRRADTPALEHKWVKDEAASTAPICGTAGEDVFNCTQPDCPVGTKREPVAALEHDWKYSEELSEEPKCGVPGKDVYVCQNANCPVGTEEHPINALEHDFDYDYYDKMTVTKAPTADEVGKATVPCRHGCGTATKEVDLDKLANKIGDDDNYISSKDAILPEDIDISINKGDEKDGKVEVEFTFDSNIVQDLEGDIDYVLDLSEVKKEYTNFKAYKVNADGTRTLVSEIKGDQLIISANLKDTLVLTYEEIEDVKSPVTGDSMNVTVFAVIALLAVAGLAVIGKKRFAL